MAEHQQHRRDDLKSVLPNKGPAASQVVAVLTLFPIGGVLLTLSGVTLTGTVIGLVLTTPLFVLFSPVLVPAIITLTFVLVGFLASGVFVLTALSSLSRVVKYSRGARPVDSAKHQIRGVAGQVGQRMKDVGQAIQAKAGQEGGRT